MIESPFPGSLMKHGNLSLDRYMVVEKII